MTGDNEKRGEFFAHFNPIMAKLAEVDAAKAELNAAKAEVKALSADLKKLKKQAIAEGFTAAEIDFAIECMKSEDETLIVERQRRMHQVMVWLSLPVGSQGDMFEDRRPAD
jgi:hypothetical protein